MKSNFETDLHINRECLQQDNMPGAHGIYKVIGGDTECPLQVCQLSRSSESTHFLLLRGDVALFDSTRAPRIASEIGGTCLRSIS